MTVACTIVANLALAKIVIYDRKTFIVQATDFSNLKWLCNGCSWPGRHVFWYKSIWPTDVLSRRTQFKLDLAQSMEKQPLKV